jgi:hypothetical protein
MAQQRKPVPAGRRWPVVGIGLAVLAAGAFFQAITPTPPPAVPPLRPTATLPLPTLSPAPLPALQAASGTLLITSASPDPLNPAALTTRLTAIQLATGAHLTAPQISDVIAAPDGTRWFALSSAGAQSSVVALDALTAAPLWQTPIADTLRYANGPSALALAPDGTRLYVLSYDGLLRQWLQVVDTATGELAGAAIPLPDMDSCGGVRFAAPPGDRQIYLKCQNYVLRVFPASGELDAVPFREPAKNILVALNTSTIYGVIDGPRLVGFDLINNTYNSNPNSFRHLSPPDRPLLKVEPGLIELSGDRQFLVVGSVTETTELRVYSTTAWQETARISYPRPIRTNTLAVNADGSRIYAVTARAGTPLRPDPIMLELPNLFPGDRNRFVLTAEGGLATVDTVQRPAPNSPADTIVELDVATGAVRSEYTRPGEDITRIAFVP